MKRGTRGGAGGWALCWLAWACLACAHHAPREPRQLASRPASAEEKQEAPELIEVRLLFVAYGEDGPQPGATALRTKEQAAERAQLIARMARSGSRFAELVSKYSDRPGAAEDFGLFRMRPREPNVFGEKVLAVALALAPGGISDPVETDSGYYLVERRLDPPGGPVHISAKHILISWKGAERAVAGVERDQAEARSLAEQIARKAKAGEDWATLAAQHTDEPGSKETGGDLGSFGRGQMVPAFEKAAFGLAVGEVSGVVESPFGYHVIMRYD